MKIYRKIKYRDKRLGKYILEKPLGEGRYALCFLASSDTGEKVVIKKFKRSIFRWRKRKEENIDEAVILSTLNDERVPELLGVINEKGFYGFILEYKQGITFKELLFKNGHKFTKEEFFDFGLQLIKIIEYLHSNGVVHRDIRIPNVLINEGKVYLIDFGLARWGDDNQHPFDLDFSFLGDFLLYLLYSSYEKSDNSRKMPWHRNIPWYDELTLTDGQKLFLKKLLRLEEVYTNVIDIENDFVKVFSS